MANIIGNYFRTKGTACARERVIKKKRKNTWGQVIVIALLLTDCNICPFGLVAIFGICWIDDVRENDFWNLRNMDNPSPKSQRNPITINIFQMQNDGSFVIRAIFIWHIPLANLHRIIHIWACQIQCHPVVHSSNRNQMWKFLNYDCYTQPPVNDLKNATIFYVCIQ